MIYAFLQKCKIEIKSNKFFMDILLEFFVKDFINNIKFTENRKLKN